MNKPHLRVHEWMFIAYFAYVAAISPLFTTRPRLHGQPLAAFVIACLLIFAVDRLERTKLAFGIEIARDWLPMGLLLLAFREMDFFSPSQYDFLTEMSWIRWDWVLLEGYSWRARIESVGALLPAYLEVCYLLVYGVGWYCVARLSARAGRKAINRFWTVFLLGTLATYAMFPFFPTEPPRYAFPDVAMPMMTGVRQLNLYLLGQTTIHSGVFPSAHVSCAFSAAFAMLLLMPKKWDGFALLAYAASVAVATIYGRYHYAVDAFAGFGMSLPAAALCLIYYARDLMKKAAPGTN